MLLRLLLATLHLLALGIGLGAVWARARALRVAPDGGALARALRADAWWGLAAFVWVGTGVWRLFAGTEKATAYYLDNHLFLTKMALFLAVFLLEIRPMRTLIRWRRELRQGREPDLTAAPALAAVSVVQAVIVVVMVGLAVAMARGYGA